jgi:hypothetical protein
MPKFQKLVLTVVVSAPFVSSAVPTANMNHSETLLLDA